MKIGQLVSVLSVILIMGVTQSWLSSISLLSKIALTGLSNILIAAAVLFEYRLSKLTKTKGEQTDGE